MMNATQSKAAAARPAKPPALAGDDWSCALTGEFCDLDLAQQERLERKAIGDAASYELMQAAAAAASIIELIKVFERSIDPGEEVRLAVVSGPGGAVICPHSIVAVGPDKILFAGVDRDEQRVVVLQHVTQLNIMLVADK